MTLIGLTGATGAGKSTLAKRLTTLVPNAVCLAFSTPLRAAVDKLVSKEDDELEWRAMMKQISMPGWGVVQTPSGCISIWTNICMQSVDYLRQRGDCPLVVIEDVRRLEEKNIIEESGGFIIEITHPGKNKRTKIDDELEVQHRVTRNVTDAELLDLIRRFDDRQKY